MEVKCSALAVLLESDRIAVAHVHAEVADRSVEAHHASLVHVALAGSGDHLLGDGLEVLYPLESLGIGTHVVSGVHLLDSVLLHVGLDPGRGGEKRGEVGREEEVS